MGRFADQAGSKTCWFPVSETKAVIASGSGHVGQAVRNGVPEYLVMKQTGHKSRTGRIYKDRRDV